MLQPYPEQAPPTNTIGWVTTWRSTFQLDWRAFEPMTALGCVPGVLAILIAGLLSGRALPALVASTSALAVRFAAFQTQFRNANTPMVVVAIGASVSAGIRTLANAWLPIEALCTMLWGIGVG
jgi:hypothetical protein